MLHWLHSLLPHVPHYGFVPIFILVFLNNIGVPIPGKSILLGIGVILGKTAGSLWQPMAAGALTCFLGGICSFWLGRRLGHGRLGKIHWLHLTHKSQNLAKHYFIQHGPKGVFIARFIPLFPPFVANILADMAKMPWCIFLVYNLTGSLVWASGYISIGYLFGNKWTILKARLNPTELYLIVAGIALLVLGVALRHSISTLLERLCSQKSKRRAGEVPGGKRHRQAQNRIPG